MTSCFHRPVLSQELKLRDLSVFLVAHIIRADNMLVKQSFVSNFCLTAVEQTLVVQAFIRNSRFFVLMDGFKRNTRSNTCFSCAVSACEQSVRNSLDAAISFNFKLQRFIKWHLLLCRVVLCLTFLVFALFNI